MTTSQFYHDGSRALPDQFDSRRLDVCLEEGVRAISFLTTFSFRGGAAGGNAP